MAKVLIVEDSLFMRNHLAKLLADKGYETITAKDGVEGVELYRSAHPDVVLMDITMPKKDGLEALNEIRRFHPQAQVIMLTALGQGGLTARAIHLGARDYLMKPVSLDKLIQTIESVLN